MDIEEKRDRLYQVASSDPDPARRAKARDLLKTLPSKSADTGKPPVDLSRGGAADQVELQPGQQPNLASRINFNPTLNTASDALGRGMSTATIGGSDLVADGIDAATGNPGASRTRREDFGREHPFIAAGSSLAGALAPGSLAKTAGTAIEGGIAQLAAQSPRLRALLGIPLLGSAAKGAVVGGALGGAQGANENSDHPLEGAAAGATSGAKFGAGLGAFGEAAGRAGGLLRNEDIALLEKYGLEPSPVPGTPVTKEGETLSAFRNPPTGTNTAGPASRQTAALQSADEIAGDIAAREGANDARLGQLRAENQTRYGRTEAKPHIRGTAEEAPSDEDGHTVELKVPESMSDVVYGPSEVPVRRVIDALDALRQRADLPNATRGRLDEVGQRIREISTPQDAPKVFDPETVVSPDGMKAGQMIDMLTKGMARTPAPQRPALQAEIARITEMASKPAEIDPSSAMANPLDMQGIKRLARNLGNQDKIQGVTASDAALRSVADAANESLPEDIRTQDRDYHEARNRTERAKESVGLSRKGTIPLEEEVPLTRDAADLEPGADNIDFSDPRTVESAGNHLARRGEDTKAGANATRRTQRLYDEGMPEVMPGAQAPDQIDVRSLMDRPRLQLAQERLQLNPSAVFSGGGVPGALSRGVKAGFRRFAYPVLKDLGNADAGPPAAAGADIVSILRLRSKLLEDEQRKAVDAETRPE